jgi:MarR family transcriptional regulator, organic hydroperoxide resistance regulator
MPAAPFTSSSPRARLTRGDTGFLLAKAAQRWNELLAERFALAGFGEVRPSFGSILIPLYEEDGLRMGELARRARLSKQTVTTQVRAVERAGLVRREPDPVDSRATRVALTDRAREFQPVAEATLEGLERLLAGALGHSELGRLQGALADVIDL